MKKSDLAKLGPARPVLRSIATGFRSGLGPAPSTAFEDLARLTEGVDLTKVRLLIEDDIPTVLVIAPLTAIHDVLNCAKATKAAGAIGLLLAMLRDTNESHSFSRTLIAMSKSMHPKTPEELVCEFSERLISARGQEAEFEAAYEALKAANLPKPYLVQLARQVYGYIDAGTSKAKALNFIRKLHDTQMKTRRAISAQGGRSAA
jgi:hypothetical protein